MLTFKTQFPADSKKDVSDVFEAGRIWLAGSPHSSLADTMAKASGIDDSWSRASDNETIMFLKYETDECLGALRHENLDVDGLRWVTEVASAKIGNKFWISVQLSVDSELPVEKIDYGKRPYILKTIMTEVGGGMDGQLPVSDKPIYLTEDQVELAADLITANAGCVMPIVYVSVDNRGEPSVNAVHLAQWLSGMAHVVVEPSRSFSFKLMRSVYSENAYGGAVAIYWPDGIGKWLFLPQGEFSDPKRMQVSIAKKVRLSLLSQRTKRQCTLGYIQEKKSKQKVLELRESGSKDIDDYIALFDIEMQNKDKEIQGLEAELNRLRYSSYRESEESSVRTQALVLEGKETDLYQGERLTIVIDALRQAKDSTELHSRRRNVLEDLIDSNNQEGERESIVESLKPLMRAYRSMTSSTKSELERLGFEISEEGKHYKLIFRGDARYSFTLSKTGSDHRGGLNAFSDLKKRLF